VHVPEPRPWVSARERILRAARPTLGPAHVHISDLRRVSTLADYAGELEARTTLRLTDRTSGVSLDDNATVQDLPFEFVVPCAATGDTSTGSVCSVSSTADAVNPGVVDEGARAVWQLGQVSVTDGGRTASPAPTRTACSRCRASSCPNAAVAALRHC
jgi:hypothetical protein